MSERLAFTLSAPAAGVHAAGRDGERCVALLRGETRTTAAVELRDAGGHFETALEGVGAVALEPLGEAIEPADGSRGWICRLVASGLEGFGSVRREPVPPAPYVRRDVWACFGGELAVALRSVLAGRTGGHGEEQIEAFVLRGSPLRAQAAEDPRLSSSYGASGELLRAGIELWEGGGEHPQEDAHDRFRALRLAGETLAVARLDEAAAVAFLAWRLDGRHGVGAYSLERAA